MKVRSPLIAAALTVAISAAGTTFAARAASAAPQPRPGTTAESPSTPPTPSTPTTPSTTPTPTTPSTTPTPTTPPTTPTPATAPPPPVIEWRRCGEDPMADCGTLRVPIDWNEPDQTIAIAVARRKATDPQARIGALVVNPGGPGGSGVDMVLAHPEQFPSDVTRRFDLVGFDPRGVRRSNPIVCSTELLARQPSPMITDEAAFRRLVDSNHTLMADCRARTGPLFDHVDTLSVVHDVEALRVALGEEKLTFLGISYGTLIGQQYAELFGDRIRAAVIDSNMDHSLRTGEFIRSEAAAVQDSLDQLASWCAGTEYCPLHETGVKPALCKLRILADQGKLAPYGFPDSFTVMQLVHNGLALPAWRDLAQYLLNLLDAATNDQIGEPGDGQGSGQDGDQDGDQGDDQGDDPDGDLRGSFSRAATKMPATKMAAPSFAAPSLSALSPRVPPLRVPWLAAPTSTATEQSSTTADGVALSTYPAPIFCEDWHLPIYSSHQFGYYLAQARRIAPDVLPALAISMLSACVGWTGPVNNPQRKLSVHAGPELLAFNSLHDPATPYAWAIGATAQLGPRAHLVTYEGSGHGVFFRTGCTASMISAYLIDLTIPQKDAKCAALPEQEE